jgi:diguanylate cyclase (GGDEF)-like protein
MPKPLGTRSRAALYVAVCALPVIALAGYLALGDAVALLATAGAAVLVVVLAWVGADRFVLRPMRVLTEELTQEAMTDPLTGLYNRRFFDDALAREIAAAHRRRTPFSVVMLDIDRFKKVNDTWGHDAGDAVLEALARLLERGIRGSDIAARYGGEEFALLLPDTPVAGAAERAEILRRDLEAHAIDYGGGRISITASFGIAQYGARASEPAAIMKAADAAMYAAKGAGRNKVAVADPASGIIDVLETPRRGVSER